MKLEHRDFLTWVPNRQTMKPEEVIEIEQELKKIREQLKLMNIANDF